MVGSTTTRPLSFREGIFRVGKEEVKICDVLMDTGALHKSYISSELVERHRDAWKESIIPYRSVARLADQKSFQLGFAVNTYRAAFLRFRHFLSSIKIQSCLDILYFSIKCVQGKIVFAW